VETFQKIGLQIPKILLPNEKIDLQKWAVIACDQFTAQPEYWQMVKEIVADAPSTYELILPEVFLGTPEEEERIQKIQITMREYLQNGIFKPFEGLIYIQRKINGLYRRGLVVCLDLEHYEFDPTAKTLIRASENTILDRIPPRIRIRKMAPLETPHILVLFDDPLNTVFNLLDDQLNTLNKIYDFELMLGSGHLKGYQIDNKKLQQDVAKALENLAEQEIFSSKYNLQPGSNKPLLFAVGDGNHSLATAKAFWEEIKPFVSSDHPARFALVELENVHDPAIIFEPIHRLLFSLNTDILQAMETFWGDHFSCDEINTSQELIALVNAVQRSKQQFGMIAPDGYKLITIDHPEKNVPVGTLQNFLDVFMANKGAKIIDYIHGEDTLLKIAQADGNVGFFVPVMEKSDLFKTIVLDGVLPQKAFSMGTAKTKRFYLECRQIQPAL